METPRDLTIARDTESPDRHPVVAQPAILEALCVRARASQIYTYTGPTLLAVSPFKALGDVYSDVTLHERECVIAHLARVMHTRGCLCGRVVLACRPVAHAS